MNTFGLPRKSTSQFMVPKLKQGEYVELALTWYVETVVKMSVSMVPLMVLGTLLARGYLTVN